MRKHTFKEKLLSVKLSVLTIFSAGTAALTAAYNLPETVAYGLSPQDSKLLKAEEKMMIGMAKEAFKSVPFFGVFADSFDSILDLTGAFGGSGSAGGVSKEDLEALRKHLDDELTEIKKQISKLGDELLNEVGKEMYTMNIGDLVDDMYTAAIRDSSRIHTHLNDTKLTDNEKAVEIAALIGRSSEWGNTGHKIATL